jgi:hypothetical protein
MEKQLSMRKHAKTFQTAIILLVICGLFIVAGCGHRRPKFDDSYQFESVYSNQRPQPRSVFVDMSYFSGLGDSQKNQAVITLQIQGNKASDTRAATVIRDAIRSQLNLVGGGRIKVLESQTFETDLLLSGDVAMKSNISNGQHHVQITLTDLKVTELYKKHQDSPRVALLSASTILTSQQADDMSRAMQLATTEAIVKLKHQRFFYRLNNNPSINQLKKEHILFRMDNTKSALQQLEDRLTQKLFAIFHQVSGIKGRMDDMEISLQTRQAGLDDKMDRLQNKMATTAYTVNQGVENMDRMKRQMTQSMKKLRDGLRQDVRKLIQNLPSKQIIREKETIRQIPASDLENITYRQATGIIIQVTSGDFTCVPTSSIVAEGGYEMEFAYNKDFKKKRDVTNGLKGQWGATPFQMKGFAKNNNIVISEQDANKIYRLHEYQPSILNNPGILVIY